MSDVGLGLWFCDGGPQSPIFGRHLRSPIHIFSSNIRETAAPIFPVHRVETSPASRPKFCLGLGLALVLLTWPRECAIQCKIILVVSIAWLNHCNIHYKDVAKHSDVGHKFSCVFLAMSPCVLILMLGWDNDGKSCQRWI